MDHWIADLTLGDSITRAALNFSKSTEAQQVYPFLAFPNVDNAPFRETFISSIYGDLFNRDPDPTGLAYWDNELHGYQTDFSNGVSGTDDQGHLVNATDFFAFRIGNFIMDVIRGAQNSAAGQDITAIQNKVAVASYFTEQVVNLEINWDGVLPLAITNDARSAVADTGAATNIITREHEIDIALGLHQFSAVLITGIDIADHTDLI